VFRKLLFLFFFFLLFIGVFYVVTSDVSAQNNAPTPISVSSTGTMTEPNSYEMFWPLVAGKTMGDSMYFLKTLKEDVVGALIFGASFKANNEVLLATKRVLEAEKLVKEGKIDNTKKTLEAALSQLDNASKNIDSAKSAGMNSNSQEMSDRLTNLVTFTTWFSENYKDTHDLFLQVSEKSSSLLLKL
jgi:hypothetical protein